MKIGMNLLLWTDQPKADLHQPLLHKIKDWGFDGVEIPVDSLDRKGAIAFAGALQEIGLQSMAISALDASIADPSSKDPLLRRAAIESIKRSVEKTREMGADLLSGPLFQGLGKLTGKGPQPDDWKYAVETIRIAAEYAQELQVRLALEPLNRFEMFIVNTVADGARFAKDVGLPNVGLLVDTHHGNIEENHTAAAWESVAEHIFHVHISENHRGVPGTGHAIPDDIFHVLDRFSYDGWLMIEAFGQNVPGLIARLHLWRAFSEHNDDPARIGIEFIRSHLRSSVKS